MKAINLFSFTRVQTDFATPYLNMLSTRTHKENVKPYEFNTLKSLVECLTKNGASAEMLDGFFFSYSIAQISKEFDLLKIQPGVKALNIELKSEPIAEEKIHKQLRQNKYYLSHITDHISLYTYVNSTGQLYHLNKNTLVLVDICELVIELSSFGEYIPSGIEKLFTPKQFLISPLNSPEEFLNGNYFLTDHQQEIKKHILNSITSDIQLSHMFGITGDAGTGKTLLLFDIIKSFTEDGYHCCIIHSGILCEGHNYLNAHWNNVNIFSAKEFRENGIESLSQYHFIFVDEAHRIYKSSMESIVQYAQQYRIPAIFSYDYKQCLSKAEHENDIPSYLRSFEIFDEKELPHRIRTSVEIASFYRTMLNLNEFARGL